MAGLYFIIGQGGLDRARAASQRLAFSPDEIVLTEEDQDLTYAWTSHDDPVLFGPARDPRSGVRVITSGRVSWNELDWQRAERLTQYEGGLSNRLLLDAYLTDGIAAIERHNGPAILLVYDPRYATVHLLTDHQGYHPVFVYRPDAVPGCVVATLPDVIAHDSEAVTTPDYVSMAEFLRAWRATPPHTYYREIKYAGAAAHWSWDLRTGTVRQRTYWRPFEDEPYASIEDATDTLAGALEEAIRIRTLRRLGPIVCFTSGGMDSRAILFAASDPSAVLGLNLYDVKNEEARIAEQLCQVAGARYIGVARDLDYYPSWLREGARWSGGMWSMEDNHFLGTRTLVRELGARTVMTACTTDWFFKGYGLETRYATLFGRNLPVKQLTNERVLGFLPNYPRNAPPAYARDVERRMEQWFEGTPAVLRDDRDYLAVEERRVRPACYTVSVSGQIMYRVFPYDTFLADRAVVDCYSRARASWKLNSVLWGRAVSRLSGSQRQISVANYGWSLDASYAQKLLTFGREWVKRRVGLGKTVAGNGPATDGSWPDLGWYVRNSDTLKELWNGARADHRELLGDLWGDDPWKTPLDEWSRQPASLFRILTLLSHWSVQEEPSNTRSQWADVINPGMER